MRRIAATAGAVAGVLVMAAHAAAAGAPPLKLPRAPAQVIVHYEKGASASMRAAARDAVDASSARRMLLPDTQVLRVAPGTAREASRELEQLDTVRWAEPDRMVKGGAAATNDPDFGRLWGLSNRARRRATEPARGVPRWSGSGCGDSRAAPSRSSARPTPGGTYRSPGAA